MLKFSAPAAAPFAARGENADTGAAEAGYVGGVFSQVAPYYDRMNDIMSAGLHRMWKNAAVFLGGLRPGMRVLDLACGGGDLAARIMPRILPGGEMTLADSNAAMLDLGRRRLPSARAVRCRGESLPFAAGSFDRVFIGFGLRNISRRGAALSEILRVLSPGGAASVLEFAPPEGVLAGPKQCYLKKGLPFLGAVFFNDSESYRYLGESVLRFPPPRELQNMMRAAGFARAGFVDVAAGTVFLHRGRKSL